jgi:colicin import membrane protein
MYFLSEGTMRVAAIGLSRALVCAVALTGMAFAAGSAAANGNAADALAEKFAHAADEAQAAKAAEAAKAKAAQEKAEREKIAKAKAAAARRAAAQKRHREEAERAAYEADMLKRASAEAEARRAADLRKAAEQDRLEAKREGARAGEREAAASARAEQEAKRAEAERHAREAEAERQAETERMAEERRKTEEAKRRAEAAEQARAAEEKRLAEARRKAEEAVRRAEIAKREREAEEQRLAEERRKADAQRERAEAAARTALEQRRQEEAQRIADKFRLAREARERAQSQLQATHIEPDTSTRSSLGGPLPANPAAARDERTIGRASATARPLAWPAQVTVLLVLDPGTKKFSGLRGSANPILCVDDGCYVSAGSRDAASHFPRWQALGPRNTLGRNAGPCRRHLTCAYREVELLSDKTWIQPVSMGFWHHDRRDIRTVSPDTTCAVVARHLTCAKPILAHGYRAWIVPEEIAREAGPDALEAALDDGLPTSRSVSARDADIWAAKVQAGATR